MFLYGGDGGGTLFVLVSLCGLVIRDFNFNDNQIQMIQNYISATIVLIYRISHVIDSLIYIEYDISIVFLIEISVG